MKRFSVEVALLSLAFALIAAWCLPVSIVKAGVFGVLALAVWIPPRLDQRRMAIPVTIISLVMVEGLFYMVDYQPFDETQAGNSPAPYVGFYSEGGIREPEQQDVIILGGSTVHNYEFPDNETLDFYLEGLLGEPVTNWGQGAYNSRQSSILFLQEMIYPPRLVISYDGINDLLLPYAYDTPAGYPYNFYGVEAGQRMVSGRGSLFDVFGMLAQKTRTGQMLFQEEIRYQFMRTDVTKNEAWRLALIDEYRHNLQRMCDLSRVYGFDYYAFLQPHLALKKQLTDSEQRELDKHGDGYRVHSLAVYEQARAMFGELQTENPACHFVDLSSLFMTEAGELFTDLWHVTADGNQRIAEQIATEVD